MILFQYVLPLCPLHSHRAERHTGLEHVGYLHYQATWLHSLLPPQVLRDCDIELKNTVTVSA